MTWKKTRKLRARGRRVKKMKEAGLSYREIGDKIGTSRQRALQLWQAILAGTGPYEGLL